MWGLELDHGWWESNEWSAGAVVAMSSALLAHQLPTLSKFGGGTGADGDKETINESLELVAGVCRWDGPTKLVNLVTRLHEEAYAFYKSCTLGQRPQSVSRLSVS